MEEKKRYLDSLKYYFQDNEDRSDGDVTADDELTDYDKKDEVYEDFGEQPGDRDAFNKWGIPKKQYHAAIEAQRKAARNYQRGKKNVYRIDSTIDVEKMAIV